MVRRRLGSFEVEIVLWARGFMAVQGLVIRAENGAKLWYRLSVQWVMGVSWGSGLACCVAVSGN